MVDRRNRELDATKLMGVAERCQCKGVQVRVPETGETYRGRFERIDGWWSAGGGLVVGWGFHV
jgi:hypothetical protein